MPRHWDPEELIVNKRLYNMFNKITKKLDSSVKHWNDTICCTIYLLKSILHP
nr:hypothetical protein [Wolbachia endosymbiont (group B) of Athalia cordata]